MEIWFTDEARVGQQGTLTRVWAKRGSRPRAVRDRRYDWAYLFGAVCPARSTGAAMIMPDVNIEAMNEHLAEISRRVSVGAIALLMLDGAGWHSSPNLTSRQHRTVAAAAVFSRIEPGRERLGVPAGELPQPSGLDNYDAIRACAEAWNRLMELPERSLPSPAGNGQNR